METFSALLAGHRWLDDMESNSGNHTFGHAYIQFPTPVDTLDKKYVLAMGVKKSMGLTVEDSDVDIIGRNGGII